MWDKRRWGRGGGPLLSLGRARGQPAPRPGAPAAPPRSRGPSRRRCPVRGRGQRDTALRRGAASGSRPARSPAPRGALSRFRVRRRCAVAVATRGRELAIPASLSVRSRLPLPISALCLRVLANGNERTRPALRVEAAPHAPGEEGRPAPPDWVLPWRRAWRGPAEGDGGRRGR